LQFGREKGQLMKRQAYSSANCSILYFNQKISTFQWDQIAEFLAPI
jgi:hypothetical protein